MINFLVKLFTPLLISSSVMAPNIKDVDHYIIQKFNKNINSIEINGEQLQKIVDLGINKDSKWDGTLGETIVFNLEANNLDQSTLMRYFPNIETEYYFKWEDNVPLSSGNIKDFNAIASSKTDKVLEKNVWNYSLVVNTSNTKDIYDN